MWAVASWCRALKYELGRLVSGSGTWKEQGIRILFHVSCQLIQGILETLCDIHAVFFEGGHNAGEYTSRLSPVVRH